LIDIESENLSAKLAVDQKFASPCGRIWPELAGLREYSGGSEQQHDQAEKCVPSR